ncbi:MAG: ArsR family transcriptional regulator [Bacteroidetes bacterium]|nr:MAG: ArsR family transcriptional regulator [Bacteroidota bacterium]
MSTKRKQATYQQLQRAITSLELLSDKQNQQLLHQLDDGKALALMELSKRCDQSPGKTKKQLEHLKAAGLVFSPKRYPKSYAANKVKVVKIAIGLRKCAL